MNVYPFIAAEKAAAHHVATACALLEVSQSAYYQWSKHVPSVRERSDGALSEQIVAIHTDSRETYGAPRVHRQLRRNGIVCGRRRVARLMAVRGLTGRAKRRWKRTTITDPSAPPPATDRVRRAFAPGLLELDRVWVGDITIFRTWEGWCYLATVIDLASRRVVGFAMADHMRVSLVTDALRMAIMARRPRPGLIFHSDRGSQYTSATFRELLGAHGVVQSLSRPRQCWDNAVAERASSPRSRPSSSTAPHGRREALCGVRSSSSSRCSTIADACTPRSATAPLRSTRQRCSHARGSLRRPKQTVRQTGASLGGVEKRRAKPFAHPGSDQGRWGETPTLHPPSRAEKGAGGWAARDGQR